ncbi:MAG: DEAD/DEAH box helicase [Candidatus Omnitrophota bacterium]|nr:DEAD/DEAH box helicase [Candidatus Omnitrophota bacterium]
MNTKKKSKKVIKRLSHAVKPKELSLEEWQILLRRQIAQDEAYRIKNIGADPIFSTFELTNPKTERTYRVVIWGEKLGVNYCSCPDYSVNTLGTCKHIEYLLRRLRRKKGAKKILEEGYVPEYSFVTLRYGLRRRVAFSIGKSASNPLKKLVNQFFDNKGFLIAEGFGHFDEFVKQADLLDDDVRYHEDALLFVAMAKDADIRRRRVEKKFPRSGQDAAFEDLLKAKLYPYQKEGALFAAIAGRCIIADDMGLGKTLQAIAASEIMADCFGIEKALIICPTSLKHQWEKEIQRFSHRSVQVVQGLLSKRQLSYKQESFFKIANYDVIHRDIRAIAGWKPDIIILDEAQRIKNWRTRLARSVKKLYSPYAIVLTGTPLENRLEELHSIVGFIDKHHLGPLFRFRHTHEIIDETGRAIGYRNLNKLGESLKPILIRRRKEKVLAQLPGRIEKEYFVAMTAGQSAIHEENREITARIVNKWKRYKFLSEEDKQRLMMALQNMRMVSDDTYLIDQSKKSGNKIGELEIQLQELLEDPGVKVVIFSQWIRMFELVMAMMNARGWKYVWLHGGVPGNKRGELISRFKEDSACRVFLSTEAGGLGLNLQNASTVINLDLPWNPAVLEQRICRVHRIGQKRCVRVINFITEGSIEQGMLSLHKFKRSMFSGILDNGENEVFMGISRFNQFIKTVETATEGIPKIEEKVSRAGFEEAIEDEQTSREEVIEEDGSKEEAKKTFSHEPVFDKEAMRHFLQAGVSFLGKILKQLDSDTNEGSVLSDIQFPLGIKVKKDETTGKQALQIPLPDDEAMKKLVQAGRIFLDIFKK